MQSRGVTRRESLVELVGVLGKPLLASQDAIANTLVPHPFPSATEDLSPVAHRIPRSVRRVPRDWHDPLTIISAEAVLVDEQCRPRHRIDVANRELAIDDRHQRRPPQQEVADLADTVGGTRQVEVDERPRPAIDEHHVLGRDVHVAHEARRAGDRCRHAWRIRQFVVREVARKTERLHRIVEMADESGDGGDAIVVRDPVRPRAPGHLSGHERQRLAALIVDAQEARRPVETGVFEKSQHGFDEIGARRSRSTDGVTDPDQSLGDIPTRQRLFWTVREHHLGDATDDHVVTSARRATFRNQHGSCCAWRG